MLVSGAEGARKTKEDREMSQKLVTLVTGHATSPGNQRRHEQGGLWCVCPVLFVRLPYLRVAQSEMYPTTWARKVSFESACLVS